MVHAWRAMRLPQLGLPVVRHLRPSAGLVNDTRNRTRPLNSWGEMKGKQLQFFLIISSWRFAINFVI